MSRAEASVNGVPVEEATAKDFIMVRAKLVQRLGGANEALVWTRIDYRVNAKTPPHVDADGVAWWPVTRDELAEETGLSPDQAKRAAQELVKAGYLDVTEHRLGGNYDRTKSYRPIVEERPVEWAESPNESGRIRPMDRADSPNVPSIKTYKKTETARAASGSRGTRIPEPFEITDPMRAWAVENLRGVDVDRETEQFVDYWRGRSGAGGVKADWPATWRNWMRKVMTRHGASVTAPTTEQFEGMEWAAYGR